MMSNRRGHGTLAAALRRIGREPAVDSLTSILLVGGLSGSSVHQLEVAGEIMVLKVTTPRRMDNPWRERAARSGSTGISRHGFPYWFRAYWALISTRERGP